MTYWSDLIADASSVLGNQHGRSLNAACTEIVERTVCLIERIDRGAALDICFGSNREKGHRILSREICNRQQLSLTPENPIRELRYVTHMNTAAYDSSALSDSPQSLRYQWADRCKYDRGVKFIRRHLV